MIKYKLEIGSYENGNILHTHYLGPELSELLLYSSRGNGVLNKDASSSLPVIYYVAVVVVSMAACAMMFFVILYIKLRKEQRKAAVYAGRGTSASTVGEVDGAHIYQQQTRTPEFSDRRSLLENNKWEMQKR